MKTSYHELDYESGKAIQILRGRIGLTQAGLAEHLGISTRTVNGWEAGERYPNTERLKNLIALAVQRQAWALGSEASEIRVLWTVTRQKRLIDEHWLSVLLSEHSRPLPHVAEAPVEETGNLVPVTDRPASEPTEHAGHETETQMLAVDQGTPVLQNLPFPPNPFFTGRENDLLLISRLFEKNTRIAITQPISVSGLGGIGKTQVALEYAHRCHPTIYPCVFWVNASDKASLEASYLALAHLLQLPEEKEREVDRVVQAVKCWLEHHGRWLLVLDNADDLELVSSFLPTRPRGHTLLTTRTQIVGHLATLLSVDALPREEGLIFLLRRSGVLKSDTTLDHIEASLRHEAEELVKLLAGHPLAIDQAGAYIEETRDPQGSHTGRAFREYRQLYHQESHTILKIRGSLGGQHPESVALTFEISLQKACQLYPGCADVLSFCALLHPDTISEELLCQGMDLDQLHFNETIRALRRYSLVKRDDEKKLLSVHRLVQAVIRESMDRQTLQRWTECVVQVLNNAFPEVTFEEWKKCEHYLPHALHCVNTPLHEMVPPPQVSHLLTKAGTYLQERGQYADAEPLLERALSICEQHLGPEHPDTATSLHNLANLYRQQGKYKLAEPLYRRALSLRERHLGPEHPDTATSLHNLANLYKNQGKYELAEPLYQRALSLRERHLGETHPDTAQCLNNLANLYKDQGKYERAEPLYQRALSIREQHLGETHPQTANSLNDLAILYWYQGKYERAEPLCQQALTIRKQQLGPEHPDIAQSLNNVAIIYKDQGKYEQAEQLYLQAFALWERHLGPEHPNTARCLNNLAELSLFRGKYEQAEPLYLRALAILEQHLEPEHPDIAEVLHELAELHRQQGKHEQAELLFQRAIAIREKRLGAEHTSTASSLHALAELYQQQGKYEQAEPLYLRALAIWEKGRCR